MAVEGNMSGGDEVGSVVVSQLFVGLDLGAR